jgi:quinol monooxygenase YgiN
MIVVVAQIELDPAQRDACVAASVPVQKATRDDEPGCLAYCFGADPVEPDRIQVYELWEDEASLHAHFQHPNYHQMRTLLGGFGLRNAVSRKFRSDLDEPVYDETRTPRADFFTAR